MSPTAVLLLHGIQSGPSTWWRVGADLTALGFAVTTPTLAGNAGVPAAGSGTVAALAETVAPARPCFVVGHSLGALVALELAARHPDLVTGLVLEDPPASSIVDPARLQADVEIEAERAQRDPDGYRDELLAANPLWGRQDVQHAVANRATVDIRRVVEPLRAGWDLIGMARGVRCPITLIAATPGGSALGGEERAALLSLAIDAIEVESGHAVHRDRPGVWTGVVAEAASRTLPPGTGTPEA